MKYWLRLLKLLDIPGGVVMGAFSLIILYQMIVYRVLDPNVKDAYIALVAAFAGTNAVWYYKGGK